MTTIYLFAFLFQYKLISETVTDCSYMKKILNSELTLNI